MTLDYEQHWIINNIGGEGTAATARMPSYHLGSQAHPDTCENEAQLHHQVLVHSNRNTDSMGRVAADTLYRHIARSRRAAA
jgi:hypothetical protein